MFFLLFLLDDRRIRIREAPKHMDPTDPDPQHCLVQTVWYRIVRYRMCKLNRAFPYLSHFFFTDSMYHSHWRGGGGCLNLFILNREIPASRVLVVYDSFSLCNAQKSSKFGG